MPKNLFQRNGIWQARVQVNGADVRRSLRTRSEVKAKVKLEKILEQAALSRQGEERHTWKDAATMWSAHSAGALAASTVTRYKISLRLLRPWLDELYLDEITKATIGEIISGRKKRGVTNATVRRDLTAMSSVLDTAEAQGWIETNAARDYNRRTIKERRDPISLPSKADIDFVVGLAPGNFASLVRFAQFTGMRQEEVAALEHRQFRGDSVDLFKTKTNRPRSLILDERAAGTKAGAVQDYKSVYVFHHGGARYKNVASRFRAIMRRAIVKAKGENREFKPFRFHDLRHWYAVDFLRRGGGIYDLQQVLGHSSVKTTEIYLAHLTAEEAKQSKNPLAQKPAQG